MSTLFICVLFGILLIIVSLNDFLFYRIEDEVVLSLIGLYILSCILGVSGGNFLSGLYMAITGFIVTLIMNRFNLIGGGDVKLLFPLLLFSEKYFNEFLIGVSLGGVVLALAYIFMGQKICDFRKKTIKKLQQITKKHNKTHILNLVLLSLSRIDNEEVALTYKIKNVWRQEIPYGLALSCGAFYVVFEIWLSR